MAKFTIFHSLVINFIIFSISTFHANIVNGIFCEEVTDAIAIKREEKTTHLHFYFHDIVGGQKPSVVKIAGPSNSSSAYGFGATMMMDDALTEGPEISSKLVGRAQGIYGIAAQEDVSLLMVMNFAFTEGSYNGSSISILGRNPVFNDVREMPIVGGSGVFRLARGYALAHTIRFDYKTGDATVEYHVYVSHYGAEL
ncbi:Plant disease resistance response protein [Corchorus olitorius]|uniref:Dirigent protein n=1 Tax=Corchorus olitorius TaxID=93759 RepID=A0A1R3HZV2_9ROSI|nr:Plant disease resistance response protein [Corchorus olitorius]